MFNETSAKIIQYSDKILAQFFGKIIVAVVILLIGFILGRIAGRIIYRIMHEIEFDKALKRGGMHFTVEKPVSHLVTYFIYFMAIIWALNAIGLTTTILNMISAAALVLIIVSILIAIKDFIPNVISSFFIFKKRLIEEGDIIKIDNLQGKVKNISLIETEILTRKGDIIHIPNATLTNKELIVRKSKK